ncbi:hypothetical protein RIF29_00600 [Crotalaria pallida]|uniref:Uncharacterized protein n=1 Tax=Crotalaria pallida TaxID=3830 RepID=A0AAN9IWB0_CROPI
MNLLLYMAPIAVAVLLPATLLMEQDVISFTISLARKDITIIWYLLFSSSLAYFVNLTNFLVTKHTSALTLQCNLAIDSPDDAREHRGTNGIHICGLAIRTECLVIEDYDDEEEDDGEV